VPLVIYLLLSLVFPKVIKIEEISCVSQYGPCSSYLSDIVTTVNHKSLAEAKRKLADSLKSEPSVSDFSFQFKIPNKLQVNLIERKPKFALKDAESNRFALVDEKGLVLKIMDTINLPYLTISDNFPSIGNLVEQKKLFALNLIYDLFTSYQVKSGNIKDQSLLVELPNGISVTFPLEGNRETLLGSLSIILTRLKESEKDIRIGDNKISSIDLRFKNPILK
jgi:cell division septal protein FtsQ